MPTRNLRSTYNPGLCTGFERRLKPRVSFSERPCRSRGWLPTSASMKFLPLFALLAFTGCQTTYHRVTVTNFDGEPVSEWVTEGPVRRTDQGYAVRAVERSAYGAYPVV